MIRLVIIVVILLFVSRARASDVSYYPDSSVVMAQPDTTLVPTSSIWYLQLAGDLIGISFNYEVYPFSFPLPIRLGLGIYANGDVNGWDGAINTVLSTHYLLQLEGRHFLEVGGGFYCHIIEPQAPMPRIHKHLRAAGVGILGYRFQKIENDQIILRFTITPFFDGKLFYPAFGVSFGW
jgi:hypothetical protein